MSAEHESTRRAAARRDLRRRVVSRQRSRGRQPWRRGGRDRAREPRDRAADALGLLDRRAVDDEQSHGAAQRDRGVPRHRPQGRTIPRAVHERLAVPREGDDRVGVRVGEPRLATQGGRDREPRALAGARRRRRRRIACSGSGCAATPGIRRTSTRTISPCRRRRSRSSSEGARTSRFDEWLEAQRLRKRVMVEPAPFPSGRPFAPARPLPRASTTSH